MSMKINKPLILSALALLQMGEQLDAAELNNHAGRSCCSSSDSAPAVQLTDKSLYQLDATWTNDLGQALSLSALKGRPQVVAMFFGNCQYACPLLVYKMQQIAAALPENVRTNVGFLLVSFDVERDTPEALHRYRAQRELGNNWTLLHGNDEQVLELAALLGVKLKKDPQGQFLHSNILTLLKADGEIAFQEAGLDLETTVMVHQIHRLVPSLKKSALQSAFVTHNLAGQAK